MTRSQKNFQTAGCSIHLPWGIVDGFKCLPLLPIVFRWLAEGEFYDVADVIDPFPHGRTCPLHNAETVLSLIGGWIEDYNENHPRSGLKWKSPREFIRAKTQTP